MTRSPKERVLHLTANWVPWIVFFAGFANLLITDVGTRLTRGYDFTADFGITEWLINYQAGFTRRGLIGEAVYFLWTKTGYVSPIATVIWASVIIYAAYVLYVCIQGRRTGPGFVLPCAFIAGGPLYTNNVVRKDVLLLLIFAGMIHFTFRQETTIKKAVTANFFMIAGMLIHELFAFIALPAMIFLFCTCERKNQFRGHNVKNLIWMLPSIATFIAILTRHDVPHAAHMIHESWRELWNSSNPWPLQPGGSIAWINKSLSEGVTINFGFYSRKYLGVPAIVWLALNILTGYLLVIASIATTQKDSVSATMYTYFLGIQFASLSPLFIIAIDSGRWAILASASAFILLIEYYSQPFGVPFKAQGIWIRSLEMPGGQNKDWCILMISGLLIFIGIPGVWWSGVGFVESAPIYQVWKLSRALGLTPALGELLEFLR